jgi:hypothetical protein
MATPSVVKRATDYNYVSSIEIAQNLHKPVIDTELTRRYGDQDLTGFLALQGAMNPVAAIEYSHYEDDWLHEVVRATNGGAGAAGATVTCTAVDSKTFALDNSPYVTSGATETVYVPRDQDIVMIADAAGRILALVTGVAGASFDLTPLDAADAIPALTGAEEMVVIGNTFPEQSGQPDSRNGKVNLYKNNLMIKKSTNSVSGTEAGVQTWIELGGKGGKKGYLWYLESQYQEYRRFMNECEMTMLLGEKITNPVIAAIGANQTTTVTEGLLPFIEANGNTIQYSGLTGFTMADLDNMVKTLDREMGSKENTIWAGINLSLGMDDTFLDLYQAGAVSYGAFGMNQDAAVNMQFSSFKRGNYVFHKKTYDAFNYQKALGAVGQEFPDIAIVIPADNVAEGKTKMSVPSLRMNYLQGSNGYSRDYEEWLTGAANGIYNTDIDEINVHSRAHRGFEGFAANRFLKIEKA